MDVPYFNKENLQMSASDETTFKIILHGNKSSLKTKWYHSCGCCDDSRSCEQLKKQDTDKYSEEKLDFKP